MATSKVIYGGRTLIDLTNDTVTAIDLKRGITAHGKDGELITGVCDHDSNTMDATAAAAEILSGKSAYVRGAKVTGTMPNNGGVNLKISRKTQSVQVPQGYHDGSGHVDIDSKEADKLIPENIRQGVSILGVEGAMSGTEGANAQTVTVTPTTAEFSVLPDTSQGYNYLAEVIVEAIPYNESTNAAGGTTVTIG